MCIEVLWYQSSLSRPTDGASSVSRPQQTNAALALAIASDETPRLNYRTRKSQAIRLGYSLHPDLGYVLLLLSILN